MAARRVSIGYLVTALVLALGAAATTFKLKYAVRELERELSATEARIGQERWRTQAARADLAWLTRPDRMALQADQLGMVPARGGRIVAVARVPDWAQLQWAAMPMPVLLPSGSAVELRTKPMPLADGLGGGLD